VENFFCQTAPQLGNQYDDDRLLRSLIRRRFSDRLAEAEEPLREMGHLSGGELYELQLQDRLNEPRLVQWDAWGQRVDRIELSPLWRKVEPLAAEFGLVATGYEQSFGPLSRSLQFALVYLFHPSSDVYTCPLAMSDGAASTLIESGNRELVEHAVPHLLSRDPGLFWTSGQWMTEATGGSDVGLSESVATPAADGSWSISGRKWFTSAAASQMALTLARPQGNPAGGRGLALFYVETRDAAGEMNGIQVARLKDKLGTRKVPTAELLLENARARLVGEAANGIRQIVPMLTMTRTWNSVCAAASMRRGLALARDYSTRREAFGKRLGDHPLHLETLAGLQAEAAGALVLCFKLTDLIGLRETDGLTPVEEAQLRLLTSLTKLTTGRQAVTVASEVLEAFGGAGYVEDTGLPVLLRDSQVMPIWEGTTNVLSLDLLKALGEVGGPESLLELIDVCVSRCSDADLAAAAAVAHDAAVRAATWLASTLKAEEQASLEAGARRFALTLGRAMELALLCEHAQWALDQDNDKYAADCALILAGTSIDCLTPVQPERAKRVAMQAAYE
jgi:acyl-CoA dehydrogenase